MDKSKLMKLAKLVMNFGQVKTDNGVLIYEGDELVIDTEVSVEQDGDYKPAPDGEYKKDEKTIIVVKDGKVSEIKEIEEEKPVDEESVKVEMEDTVPPVEEEVTVVPDSEVKIKEFENRIAELEEDIAEKDKEIERLNEYVKELENKNLQPVEDPIDQSPKVEDTYSKLEKDIPQLRYFRN